MRVQQPLSGGSADVQHSAILYAHSVHLDNKVHVGRPCFWPLFRGETGRRCVRNLISFLFRLAYLAKARVRGVLSFSLWLIVTVAPGLLLALALTLAFPRPLSFWLFECPQ